MTLPQVIGRVILPSWFWVATGGLAFAAMGMLSVLIPTESLPRIKVAMIGNSMMYYNDLPRFMEIISDGHIVQNSCLHGNANLNTILVWGNGMYNMWRTGDARIFNYHRSRIYDFGACTVPQLLFGFDDSLEYRVQSLYQDGNDDDAYYDDDQFFQSDNTEPSYTDDYFSYWDGSNPCLRNPHYYNYLKSFYSTTGKVKWDFIILNDNTRTPARSESRQESLDILKETYLPWFLELGATPVFLATYGYWTPYRDMTGLVDVPEFTSLTLAGYREYANMLAEFLPEDQQPRVAPVGLAFLVVWEENRALWQRLFHVDQIHCGPMGTYLQGLVVHYTLFGKLPPKSVAIRGDMSSLFITARRFQPKEHTRDPFPTPEEAAYLYQVAVRVCVHKQVPRSFKLYTHGEAAEYDPIDDLYKVDDLF